MSSKAKKKAQFSPYKFKTGDFVMDKENGLGRICQIDPNNHDFNYFVSFENKTKKWLSKYNAERKLVPAAQN